LLFPNYEAVAFGPIEAAVAAAIYRSVKSPRRRQVDIAIAATAISRDVALWTLNRRDFEDIPGLRLL
jgi:predicted nucleic acid-binding protein